MADEHVRPQAPEAAGLPPAEPAPSRVEGSRVLADSARERLGDRGFTHDQVVAWAEAFLVHEEAGDVDAFVAWVEEQQA